MARSAVPYRIHSHLGAAMPVLSLKVEDLIPHRPPMVLIDAIESVELSENKLVASFTAREEWRGNWFALEYMAQTAAALAGAFDRASNENAAVRPGFLLGTRRLDLGLPEFEPGSKYLVLAVREYEDGDSAVFSCEIREFDASDCSRKCTATLTAYRPPLR